MKPPYRAALIGCGRIGDAFAESRGALGIYSHAEAYVACARTDLVAVCDIDSENLRRCADRWQIAGRFSSFVDALAQQSPEIVSICTPDETHFAIAEAVLEAPATRAVLLEKPLAVALADAQSLVAKARERDVLLAVNYSRRYAASYRALREDLGSGRRLGSIRKITGFYTKGILHNGTHWLDLCRFFGEEVRRVEAFPSVGSEESDPTPDVRIEFRSGATGYLHGCDGGEFAIFEMDILTSAGRVRLSDSGQSIEVFVAEESRAVAGYRYLQPSAPSVGALRDVTLHAVEDLAACLDEPGRAPQCSGHDAFMALAIGLKIRASAQAGKPMEVHLPS